jgi:predicted metal-dependent phosphoesterase TrpH
MLIIVIRSYNTKENWLTATETENTNNVYNRTKKLANKMKKQLSEILLQIPWTLVLHAANQTSSADSDTHWNW